MPFTYEEYEERPWWRKFSERWSSVGAYLCIALASAAGWQAATMNSEHDAERNKDTIEVVVCGLKFFVSDLIEAGSNREAVLEKLAARLPTSTDCVEGDRADP